MFFGNSSYRRRVLLWIEKNYKIFAVFVQLRSRFRSQKISFDSSFNLIMIRLGGAANLLIDGGGE